MFRKSRPFINEHNLYNDKVLLLMFFSGVTCKRY